jgi:hypothetical protein
LQSPRSWFTANIGYHHIHHLSSRIPNYRLIGCHNEYRHLFGDVTRVKLAQVPRALKYILWDARAQRIISVADYRAQLNDPWFTLLAPVLKLMPRKEVERIAPVGARSVQALCNGHWKPKKEDRTVFVRAAGDYARKHTGLDIRDDLCACAAFLEWREHLPVDRRRVDSSKRIVKMTRG